jgi:uncharacterized delta-60 repeat protein
MTTTGSVSIQVITVKSDDPTKTGWGALLSAQYHFVIANGTAAAETFDAADIPQATRDLMALWGRGVIVNMGEGDDTVIGSSYGDIINAGTGVNKIDGGANQGFDPNGVAGRDVLNVFANSQADADAITVTNLAQDGADAAHYAEGYRIKVVSSATGETSYLKDVEKIDIFVNGSFARSVELANRISEASSTVDATNMMHLAWVQGSGYGETFNAATDISSATQTRMAQYGRGLWLDAGAGDDVVTGSAYGDDITAGEGTNYIDGGANGGAQPHGGKALDVLHVRAATQADADAITVTQLTGSMSGTDAAAFSQGYTHKVVNGIAVDYVKGIERISVELTNGSFARDIALTVVVQEANLADSNIADYYHLSWTHGTSGADTIDLSGDSALLSSALKTAMATHGHGGWINGGAGDDVITSTAYADNIVNGTGNAKIDGGANGNAQDIFEIRVASADAMSAVTVAASDDANYQWMITYGSGEKDYLKNIEAVIISHDGGSSSRWIPLAVQVHGVTSADQAANYAHLAWVQGTDHADTFIATTDISSTTRTLMDTHQRGAWIDTGAGSDTITGSAYGDDISSGAGNDYVDGGANSGTTSWGSKAQDVLHVRAADQAAADAITVVQLASTASGADAAAFSAGYTHKVVNGSETDYVKGIERIAVQVASGDGYSYGRDIPMTVLVNEVNLADASVGQYYHLSWTHGTSGADNIDLSTAGSLLSAELQTAMLTHKHGAWVDGGAGNDTITGTAYADNFRNGSGNAKIDGGANNAPDGSRSYDIFEISVGSAEELAALTVAVSDDSNYQWMVTYGTGQKDYLKNIEAVVASTSNGNGFRWIPLAVNVSEISSADQAANFMHLAWANGTEQDDNFDAANDISAATRALMGTHQRGVWVDLGAGNDTIIGSGYGDDFNAGTGTNFIDGGAHAGSLPWGGKALDVLHVTANSQAAADAVSVIPLTSGMSGTDAAAFTAGYTHKVVNGSTSDYFKGIERISVQVVDGINYSAGREINLAVVVQEANLSDSNLGLYSYLSYTHGTDGADTIDLSGDSALFSSELKSAMATHKGGAWVDGGTGNDTITGTAYGDSFRNGSGNAKIDGGANEGRNGGRSRDIFEITVESTDALAAVTVTASDDPQYQWMVTYGTGQKDYLKNIEALFVYVSNGNGSRYIPLSIDVNEVPADAQNLSNYIHFAWVHGTDQADSFNVADLSSTVRALMTTHQRGVYIDAGAGDDSVTGSAYPDHISVGAGTNRVDGGDNLGSLLWGRKAEDVLQITVSSQAESDAVAVTQLASGMSGSDASAFTAGYTHKVVHANGADYIKGIERISVTIQDGNHYSFGRDIALSVLVQEADLSASDIGNYYHLSWTNGTEGADTIDLSSNSNLLSPGIKTAMDTHKRGGWVNGGPGNDLISGSAYGDNFVNGPGNARIDGGANAGPGGVRSQDMFEIRVASPEALAAVSVVASDDSNYQWMVTYGTGEKDYLKNIESVIIWVENGTASRWIPLAMSIHEVTGTETQLDHYAHFAWANGTGQADAFDATSDISAATRALMNLHQRGVFVDSGAGNDTITGSAYGDEIRPGAGTNYIDGGANTGDLPWGAKALDRLQLTVGSQAELDGLSVVNLVAGMDGVDAAAFVAGYTHKVASTTAVNYFKGIETISITIVDGNNLTYGGEIALSVQVNEVDLADANVANYMHLSNTNGTPSADQIDLSATSTLLSSALQAAMVTHKRGVWVDGGAGNDTITGSGYADHIRNGSGNSRIDGGAHDHPGNTNATDVFEIRVANTAAMSAVSVAPSDDPAYQWMVTYGTGEKDYLKNVESIVVMPTNGGVGRVIPLSMQINEVPSYASEFSNFPYLVNVSGTMGDDSFSPASDVSAATRAVMDQLQRGVQVDLGAGNDTAVGSAYGDAFMGGAGTNHIDGGIQLGAAPFGGITQDTLTMYVKDQAAADGVALTALTSGMSGADAAAFAAGYTYKVSNGTSEVNYLKNIEQVTVTIWDDKNGDGMLNYAVPEDPANEVLDGPTFRLLPNSAPAFKLPAGVFLQDGSHGLVPAGGLLLADGKILTSALLSESRGNANVVLALTRSNADGSADASFGVNGIARVALPMDGITAPVLQTDGKILVGLTSMAVGGGDFAVMRLLADGSIDSSFGSNGIATMAINGQHDEVRTVMVQADGKIVLAGIAHVDGNRDFALARLNADGSADTSFNGTGKLVVAIGSTLDEQNAATLAPDGKIVLVGHSHITTVNRDISAIRVNQDGTLDTSFGNGGKVLLAAATDDKALSVKVQADGKILIGGHASGMDGGTVLLRLGADGTPDSTFGVGGKLAPALTRFAGPIYDLVALADGKVLALSSAFGDIVVSRYLPDGSVDTTFGAGGRAALPWRLFSEQPKALLVSGDKIVVVNNSYQGDGLLGAQVLMRLNLNGTPDPSFGLSQPSSLGGVVLANGVVPQQLDANAMVFDAEMHKPQNYHGATLTLQRQGGANPEDVFGFMPGAKVVNGILDIEGASIATVVQSAGKLQLLFNQYESAYTAGLAIRAITYSNSNSSSPPASVALEWTISDGNTGAQGFGGALSATAVSTVQIGATVAEAMRQYGDPTLGVDGEVLAARSHFATVTGSARADQFDSATGLSASVRALMAEFQRGFVADMGMGDDVVVGSGYGDRFILGAGTNYADGGANLGTLKDRVDVFVPNLAAASTVQLSALGANLTGVDAAAAAQGYTHKLVFGQEISFLKNIEELHIQVWNDLDGDGLRDYSTDASNEVTPIEIITIGTSAA